VSEEADLEVVVVSFKGGQVQTIKNLAMCCGSRLCRKRPGKRSEKAPQLIIPGVKKGAGRILICEDHTALTLQNKKSQKRRSNY
jgi:hypothetical protein